MKSTTRSVMLRVTTTISSTRFFGYLACLTLVVFIQPVSAATGALDITFGGTGKVTTDIGSGDSGHSVVVQSDGKIVVVGSFSSSGGTDFAVVRYNSNGSLDTTFNGSGKTLTAIGSGRDQSNSVALQSDGKIVVAGFSNNGSNDDFAVVRYNSNGSLDTSFSSDGKATTDIGSRSNQGQCVAVQSDGRILVGGFTSNPSEADIALVRYDPDGSLDYTFNGTGKVTTAIGSSDDLCYSLAVQGDGRIVVAGRSYNGTYNKIALVRYNPNGSLDTTFNGTGKVTTAIGGGEDWGYSVCVQDDGRIVVAGDSTNGGNTAFALVRYNANGSLDTSFNGTGKVTTAIGGIYDSGRSVVMQSDGKIVAAGMTYAGGLHDFAVVRYRTNGSLDSTFNGTGKVTTDFAGTNDFGNSVAVQSDGKIVVVGQSSSGGGSDFAVVRYGDFDTDGDGISDQYETGTGIYLSPENTGTSPTNADTDGDGLSDGQEVNTYHSNPNVRDTDGDGFDDGFEVTTGFSPTSAASTPDALSSARAAVEYRFNAANGISYRIEASTDVVNWSTIETNIIGTGGVITRFYSIEGQPRRFFRSRRN